MGVFMFGTIFIMDIPDEEDCETKSKSCDHKCGLCDANPEINLDGVLGLFIGLFWPLFIVFAIVLFVGLSCLCIVINIKKPLRTTFSIFIDTFKEFKKMTKNDKLLF